MAFHALALTDWPRRRPSRTTREKRKRDGIVSHKIKDADVPVGTSPCVFFFLSPILFSCQLENSLATCSRLGEKRQGVDGNPLAIGRNRTVGITCTCMSTTPSVSITQQLHSILCLIPSSELISFFIRFL